MRIKSSTILVGLLFLFLISCEEKTGIMEQPEVFSIQEVSIPRKISVSRVKTYSIAFKVTHPEGIDAVDSVSVTFLGSDKSTQLLNIGLYDDGGNNHPNDRDVIAKDGIYTNIFQSDSLVFPLGAVFIRATAIDKYQQQLQTDLIESLSLLNAPPVLVSISAPDTLPSGSSTMLFSVTVQDSNDIDDIDRVIMKLRTQSLTIFSTDLDLLNSPALDTALFGAYFDSSFAEERIGNYELEFQAVDISGDSSNISSQTIYLENTAPEIFNISLRDTIQRPSSGFDTLHVKISANDAQGLSDILSVGFIPLLVGGDTLGFQPMFDDGNQSDHGDDTANDGRYSTIVRIEPQNQPGTYIFNFSAEDKVGNTSIVLSDTIEVLQ